MLQTAINPWKILNSEKVYDSPWIDLTKHKVLDPSGNDGTYSVVHFKNLAIGILPLDEEYNTWIVGQYRFPIETYSWEIPEGGGKLNVPPLESAKRELSEEAGISAKKWTLIQDFYTSNSCTDERALLYVAQDLSFHQPHPDEDEELSLKKIPFSELFDLAVKGEITDALTLLAVYKVQYLIAQKLL